MPKLGLSADEVLTTTRSVRKRLDFDRPVEMELIKECLNIALQAPTGSNEQGWHFIVVTDQQKKEKIAAYYQQSFVQYLEGPRQPTKLHSDNASMKQTQEKVLDSAQYLAANMAKAPVLLIPCCSAIVKNPKLPYAGLVSTLGSVIPAAWSFMLAARERGLGTCMTTVHLLYEKEIAELLGVPDDFAQICLIPVAYTKGSDFKLAGRKPLENVLHCDSW
ncbi:MAG: nitroreductase family protein [Halieaceae bacterium]|jgi:nitroreductase|nr:nitroreductase family protein [Halieaceae bacterium]